MKVIFGGCQFANFEILAALDINRFLQVIRLLLVRLSVPLTSAPETRVHMWIQNHPLVGMSLAKLLANSSISIASQAGAAVLLT
jgi:hypothetical protein